MQATLDYFLNLPFWELLAVILSIAYVILVAKNNRWCWPAAFLSTLIFTIIFYDVSLLMESLLNGYYMAMALYGWYRWQSSKNLTADSQLPITTWSYIKHIKLIASLSIFSLLLGFIMDNYTSADFAYIDTFTTVFAVATTYLVVIKLYENWFYWIGINSLSVYLYIEKGLEPTAFLAGFNILMCVVGLINWHKIHKQERISSAQCSGHY